MLFEHGQAASERQLAKTNKYDVREQARPRRNHQCMEHSHHRAFEIEIRCERNDEKPGQNRHKDDFSGQRLAFLVRVEHELKGPVGA